MNATARAVADLAGALILAGMEVGTAPERVSRDNKKDRLMQGVTPLPRRSSLLAILLSCVQLRPGALDYRNFSTSPGLGVTR